MGVIEHPRLTWWMVPGGHVEEDETAAQGALRELVEESGVSPAAFSPPRRWNCPLDTRILR